MKITKIILLCIVIASLANAQCAFNSSVQVNIPSNGIYTFYGYYVNPYYCCIEVFNFSMTTQSVDNDNYYVGYYHEGCSTYTAYGCTYQYEVQQNIRSITGNLPQVVNSGNTYPIFTFGAIWPAIFCNNFVDSCQIIVTNLTSCQTFVNTSATTVHRVSNRIQDNQPLVKNVVP